MSGSGGPCEGMETDELVERLKAGRERARERQERKVKAQMLGATSAPWQRDWPDDVDAALVRFVDDVLGDA